MLLVFPAEKKNSNKNLQGKGLRCYQVRDFRQKGIWGTVKSFSLKTSWNLTTNFC